MGNLFKSRLCCVAAWIALTASTQHLTADLVVLNAHITTMDEHNPDAEALAVKDGVFSFVGSNQAVREQIGRGTTVIDAAGRRLIPGLNDSHTHAIRGGRFYNLELRWDGVSTLAEAMEMVREQAKNTPKGQWVRVIGGWSPFQFEEQRMPTIAELNAAAPDTPVFILYLYSKGFLNAAGVQALDISEATEPPPGSRYHFVDGGAELIADPNPMILYKTIGQLPQLSPEQMLNSTQHFYRELNRFGLTSVIDAGGGGHMFPADYGATDTLAQSGDVDLRISYYLFPQTPGREKDDFEAWIAANEIGQDFHIGHHHGYELEGAGEFIVWKAGDFENFLSPRPELQPGFRESLEETTRLLTRNRWPIRIHATYDESVSQILDVFEQVFDEENFSGRWIVDHAETVSPENLQRIAELGGGIAVQNRMAFAGEYFLERYGPEITSQSPPLRTIRDMGIPMGAGTDATRVSSHNPWLSLYWMVSGKTVGGTVLYSPENRLARLEALEIMTSGSAWFSGEDRVKGRIAVGQYADFALLNADYLKVPEEHIRSIESVLTVVAGRPVFAADEYEDAPFAPEALPTALPEWSPVNRFGGYQNKP